MRRTILLTGALCAMTAGLLTSAQALPVLGVTSAPTAGQSLIEKVRGTAGAGATSAHIAGDGARGGSIAAWSAMAAS